MTSFRLASAVAVAALLAAAAPTRAAERVHVRGALVSLDGSTLTVKTREARPPRSR